MCIQYHTTKFTRLQGLLKLVNDERFVMIGFAFTLTAGMIVDFESLHVNRKWASARESRRETEISRNRSQYTGLAVLFSWNTPYVSFARFLVAYESNFSILL